MKKIFVLTALMLAFSVSIFAQTKDGYVDPQTEFKQAQKIEQQKLTTQTINVPEGFNAFKDKKYMSDELSKVGGNIVIEYSPLYDEVRIYYTCMMTQYERGEAMNTVLAVLQDFLVLTEYTNAEGDAYTKERYYHYNYLVPDKEKYFKNERGFKMAQYISYLKFSK